MEYGIEEILQVNTCFRIKQLKPYGFNGTQGGDKMKNKVIAIVLVTILLVVQLTACGFHRGKKEAYKTPERQARELYVKIIDCFMKRDKDTLRSFFSQYSIENSPDIEGEMEAAFALFDGEIVSYEEPDGSAGGGLDEKGFSADSYIKTDKGTEYWLTFSGWLTCAENENKVGVSYIKVVNVTECDRREEKEWENYTIYIGAGY